MQKLKIPITLDIKKAAIHTTCYQGYVVAAQLERLSTACISVEADVDVKIDTGFDPQGLPYVKGQAQTQVVLVCQRCNQDMLVDLMVDFAYTPVTAENLQDPEFIIPEHYDPIVINDYGEINLREMIEDELLLDIPLIPKHDEQDCALHEANMTWGEIHQEIEQQQPNPFAVLKQLKRH